MIRYLKMYYWRAYYTIKDRFEKKPQHQEYTGNSEVTKAMLDFVRYEPPDILRYYRVNGLPMPKYKITQSMVEWGKNRDWLKWAEANKDNPEVEAMIASKPHIKWLLEDDEKR